MSLRGNDLINKVGRELSAMRAHHGDASTGGVVVSTTITKTTTVSYSTEDADGTNSWEDGTLIKVALKVSGLVLAGVLVVLAFEYLRRKRYMRQYLAYQEAERERESQRAVEAEKERAKKVQEKLKLVEWKKPTNTNNKPASIDETSRTDSSVSSTDNSSSSDSDDESEVDIEAQEPAEPTETETSAVEHTGCDNDDEEDDCYICLTAFEANEMVAVSCNSDCKHVFHHQCVQSWLVKNDGCPVCRRPYLDEATVEQEEEKNENDEVNGASVTLTA